MRRPNAESGILPEGNPLQLALLQERMEWGEDFEYGPHYRKMILQERQILDTIGRTNQFPSDRIVLVMADSCNDGAYLSGVVEQQRIESVSPDIQAVFCATAEEARKLKQCAPIILPWKSLQEVDLRLRGQYPYKVEVPDAQQQREDIRSFIAKEIDVDPRYLALHLGADEIIKSLMRGVAEIEQDPRIFIPFPNYFDAIEFARVFGFKIFTADTANSHEWSNVIKQVRPNVVYVSNPNNPYGNVLSEHDLSSLIEVCDQDVRLAIDETNIRIDVPRQLGMSPVRARMKKAPRARIIDIDSLSKSFDSVGVRMGFGVASHFEDTALLRAHEPPRFYRDALFDTQKAFQEGNRTEGMIRESLRSFYNRLIEIVENLNVQLSMSTSMSNFCTVHFAEERKVDIFLDNLQSMNPRDIGANTILGLPKRGAGKLGNNDVNPDGSVKAETLMKSSKTLIGLPTNAVRLSAFSHPIILKILEQSIT